MKTTLEKPNRVDALVNENRLLTEEVRVARRASEITAELVVDQLIKMETIQQQLEQTAAAEQQLYQQVQREKQYFESLVRTSPTAVVVMNLDDEVVAWNPAAETLYGYTQAEAMGRHIDDLIATPALRAEVISNIQQIADGIPVHLITKRAHKDGHLVDVELSAVSVVVDGKRVGMLAIYHDITELQQARQAAEAATQAKSAFLATMSHELRTPMNAVIGMTSLLLDTDLSHEQLEFAQTIRSSGDALLGVINDILDFSKIEAGRMELEQQPFVLRDCVEGAVDLLAVKAKEKGLNLACMFEPGTPTGIYGDVTRLRQILVNLLSNAVKFTETGEVVVTVQCSGEGKEGCERSPQGTLHFSVRDTGIGIRPEGMRRLFQSFSQVDASTTRQFGGTGLGLAISKRLAELMGGTMWAKSEGVPGHGSTFHFTIAARIPEMKPAVDLRTAQANLRGRRALIVDDNATNRRILTLQTQSWGMIPRDTGSPAQALEWVRQENAFDVAFIDMQMPDMDGVTLGTEIRKVRTERELPLVMVSSWSRRETNLPEGLFAAFLLKPLKASQMYNSLVDVFATQPERTPTSSVPQQFDATLGKRHPLRILLAEDNLVNQKVALLLLGRLGYRADVAANGLEVLDCLRRQPYDLVLMDVQMPEMDGLEATRAICRGWPTEARPQIIAMTANTTREDRDACLAAGMDGYLSKPIVVAEITAALTRCQPAQKSQASNRSTSEE